MYAGVSRITSKGQVTIPLEIRTHKKLEEGDQVIFVEVNGEIIMEKVDALFDVFSRRAKELKLTPELLGKEMAEEKERTLVRMKHAAARNH